MDDATYRQLFHSLTVPLIAADRELNIIGWNAAATAMFARPAEQMLGRSLVETVPEEGREAMRRLFDRALRQKESSEFETSFRDESGTRRFLAVTVSPIVEEGGEVVGICASVRDITRRVTLEKQLASSRTMAALGNLSGGVAHHFNNLLGGIATSVDYALSASTVNAMRRALHQTAELTARAARITQSLLTFAESDPQQDPPVPLDEAVRRFVEDRRPTIESQGIALRAELAPIPSVPVPGRRLRTVLENLCNNAVEAMPSGGELRIRLFADEWLVHLVVEDTGLGLSPEVRAHLFEPFCTTKGTLAGGGGDHVGLGLAVVHGIIRGAGGTITAEPVAGGGTQFHIRLPLPEPAEPRDS